MTLNVFLAQIIGLFAIFFWVISVHSKEQSKILYLQALANLIYVIEYLLLGVYAASAMNFTSTIRCTLFANKLEKKEKVNFYVLLIFILLILVLGILTYDGPLSLIPIIITIFYTISSWVNAKWMRIVFVLAAIVWIYYNYRVASYVGIVGNILEIISGTLSLLHFSKQD